MQTQAPQNTKIKPHTKYKSATLEVISLSFAFYSEVDGIQGRQRD